MAEVRIEKPRGDVTLHAHPEVRVHCAYQGPGPLAAIQYEGTPDALIKSGIATAEMLSGNYPGRKRVDATGDHFLLQRSFRTEGGETRPHCKVTFYKSVNLIDQMPGARQAIYAATRVRQWYDGRTDDETQSAAEATAAILARFARE